MTTTMATTLGMTITPNTINSDEDVNDEDDDTDELWQPLWLIPTFELQWRWKINCDKLISSPDIWPVACQILSFFFDMVYPTVLIDSCISPRLPSCDPPSPTLVPLREVPSVCL